MSFLSEKREDVVVSGVAGRFPKSRNMSEFSSNLFNKIDMTDDNNDRWKQAVEFIPPRSGKVADLDKFDCAFFATLSKQAKYCDPQMRILLEHVYEAILDAGISPQTLINSRTGVFIACTTSDGRDYFVEHPSKIPDGMTFSQ